MRRLHGVVLLAVVLAVTGCTATQDEVRDDYCAQVKKDGEELTRLVDEGGSSAFLEMLPRLEGLARKSPDDLLDEWQTYLNAIRGWRDALDRSGVEPEQLAGGMPEGLGQEDKRRIRGAASVLDSQAVRAASEGIEQQALDVCGTPLL